MSVLRSALAMAAGLAVAAAQACPADAAPRAAGVLLTVQAAPDRVLAFTAAELAAVRPTTLTQRLTVSAGTAGGTERSIAFGGTLVREVLARAGFGGPDDRAARTAVVEAVASDGYRAVFSWGELFNAPVGDQVLVVTTIDGQPLDALAGPLALRSLADLRPGPRHVRNLCALVVRR